MKARYFAQALCLGILAFNSAIPASAAVIVSFQDSGSDVVATASGSLDLTGLTFQITAPISPQVSGAAFFALGPTAFVAVYSGVTGPASFGSALDTTANSGSGDAFGVLFNTGELLVPESYVSGAALSSSAQWNGESVASLGLTPGTYIYALPDDSITVQIGSSVPEPATLWMLGLGCAVLLAARRRALPFTCGRMDVKLIKRGRAPRGHGAAKELKRERKL